MRLPTSLAVVVATLALPCGSQASARPSEPATAAAKQTAKKQQAKRKAAKRKAAGKGRAQPRRKCKKGYALKTVQIKRKGKVVRVKRCRRKVKRPSATTPKPPASQAPTPASPTTPGGAGPLFDPPGKTLDGAAARSYVERYLNDSRFTDCPASGSCEAERAYSHRLALPPKLYDVDLFYCQPPGESVANALHLGFSFETGTWLVGADGSWSFSGTAIVEGLPQFYTWNVAANGTVTGVEKPIGRPPNNIGPLRYATGARDCS